MPSITIENLGVEFPIYGSNSRSLKKLLVSQATGGRVMGGENKPVIVRALDEVNLTITHGDRVALTGHNGSGKSTLLRVLAGIYKPTRGSVTLRGRVSAILDPHAGIDPDATGLENIFLRGRILGLNDREIRAKLDEIVEFTELANFIALPMRTYSAGMFARLAFAVSTAVEPDILLIDEGIGAGDAHFMDKIKARLQSIVERSPILVLASHDQKLISQLCNRVVTFEHGRMVAS
ncbi:ABC transporter ATP-binding protein [Devosia submarina]|uniref:ABC transporter ATP-binding protein n=1 Tax=Devosia submarina TaxID=1173082 RepID=UPI000D38193A|nr:ABC transporter ATP-binding protein [Devosia submarina]